MSLHILRQKVSLFFRFCFISQSEPLRSEPVFAGTHVRFIISYFREAVQLLVRKNYTEKVKNPQKRQQKAEAKWLKEKKKTSKVTSMKSPT
jgi:hypothetical protein